MPSNNPELLSNILDILTQDLPPEDLVKGLGTALQKFIPFHRFSLSLSQLRFWYYFEHEQVTSQRCFWPIDDAQSASSWVFIHQKPYLRDDIATHTKFEYDQELQKENIQSDLILPLTVMGTPVGIFNFSHTTPHFYTKAHLLQAQRITKLIGLCAKQITDHRDKTTLNQITQNLQNPTDTDTILKHIMTHLHASYDRIRLYLLDNQTNTLQGKFQIDEKGFRPLTNRTYPFDLDPYTQQTIQSDLPQIYSAQELSHKEWIETIKEQSVLHPLGNHEWAEIALKAQNGNQELIIGKISLDNKTTKIPLAQEGLNKQMVFIREAAIAIWQTKLYQEMSQQVNYRTRQLSSTNHQLEQKDKLLTALQEVSHHSFSYLNQDDILDNFTERIIREGICRSLMIAVPDYQTNTVEVVRAFQRELPDGPDGPIKIVNYSHTCGTRYGLDDDNITPLTVRTGQMHIIETKSDKRLDARFEQDQSWDDKIAYFIPIKREEKVVALLATGTTRAEKNEFLERLKTMAPIFDQLGIALEHASLYQSTQTNEAHYRSLFENMQSGFAYRELILDKHQTPIDYRFLDCNQAYADLYGLHPKDIVGKTLTEIYPNSKTDLPGLFEQYVEVANTGTPLRTEIFLPNQNKWFDVSAYSPQRGFFATVANDITQKKHSEERIAELLDIQDKMLDTPVVWICAFDNERKMIFWNRGAELISGYASEHVVGSADVWNELYPETDYFEDYIKSAREILDKTGRIENIESIIHCKNGNTKTISWYANQLVDNDNAPVGFLAIGLDITQHKQLETEIVRLERLKALGELAAGVSHNLNNMLTGILLPAAMLKNTPLPPSAKENVEDIFLSATRARDLVAELNQSVRRDITDLVEPVDVNRTITEAVRATRARWKDESEAKGLKIQFNLSLKATTPARATTSGLHDVLINLIFNAVDALPKGGHITISSNMVSSGVELTVKDDGIGMSSETQLKVFEPFFTTKMDVGTGLGLSTAYSQIQRWDGSLTVQSDFGKGTQFTIQLPLWTDALVAEQKPVLTPPTPKQIIIVEDDPMIRRTLKRYLSDHHKVTLAENGQQARVALDTDTFDLAIIDLGLPDIPGDELALELKQKSQDLPAILITGWSLSDNDPRKDPFQAYLQKPIVDPNDLLLTIEQLTKKDAG